MPNYRIPIVFEMTGTLSVQAETLEEAERIALDERALPPEKHYVEDSARLDTEHSDYGEILPDSVVYSFDRLSSYYL
jgi:hypothetical protein